MLNNEQAQYIENLRQNYPNLLIDKLSETLRSSGWPDEQIKTAIAAYTAPTQTISTAPLVEANTQTIFPDTSHYSSLEMSPELDVSMSEATPYTFSRKWLVVAGVFFITLLLGGSIFVYEQGTKPLPSNEDTNSVVLQTNTETLTQEMADAIFIKHYNQLYNEFLLYHSETTASDPWVTSTHLLTDESWKFLVYSESYREIFGFWFLSSDIYDGIESHTEAIKKYIPPSEELRLKFQAQLSEEDGLLTLPDLNSVDLGTEPQRIEIDENGNVKFLPPKPVTEIFDNDTIRFNVEGFEIALVRQADSSWKFDLLLPYQKEWVTKRSLYEDEEEYNTAMLNLPALNNFLEWLRTASEAERTEFMEPIYELRGDRDESATYLVTLLLKDTKIVSVSDSEIFIETSNVGETVRIVIKKAGEKWTIGKE